MNMNFLARIPALAFGIGEDHGEYFPPKSPKGKNGLDDSMSISSQSQATIGLGVGSPKPTKSPQKEACGGSSANSVSGGGSVASCGSRLLQPLGREAAIAAAKEVDVVSLLETVR